jgi:uncharacterized protein (TIGR02145 family)
MKKFLSLIMFCSAVCGYAQDTTSIKIGKTVWATSNVGAAKAIDYGNYFTWNEAQTACPKGWRLPTKNEFKELNEHSKTGVWGTLNGVEGRWYNEDGKKEQGIFFPAAGAYSDSDELVHSSGLDGYYWSSTPYEQLSAYYFAFRHKSSHATNADSKGSKFTVRCVK